jgi:dTDP-4-amino-4,6-dideoxygalactose transaminase
MTATKRLALVGGPKTIQPDRHRPWPDVTNEDRLAVDRVLRRGVLAGPNAPEITALEAEYAAYVGVKYCVATNAGTSALHCALAAVGVEPGGQVIVPAYTFVASALAAIHQTIAMAWIALEISMAIVSRSFRSRLFRFLNPQW